MRIHTKIVFDIETMRVIEDEYYEYDGPVALCKGASAGETSIANSQQNMYNTLSSDFGSTFKDQQNILSSLTKSLQTNLAGGPSQMGYSAGEMNALNAAAVNNGATATRNAQQAAGEAAAASGGGNSVLPSGAAAANSAAIAQAGAQNTANALTQNTIAGYQQGTNNYNNAVTGLLNTSSQYNPNAYANSAISAGNSAMSGAETVQKANDAANPWNIAAGALGGIASMAIPGGGTLGGSLFKKGLNALSGLGSSKPSDDDT